MLGSDERHDGFSDRHRLCLVPVPHRLVGDGAGRRFASGRSRAFVYALSLAVYCTSWTYYGSVGLASEHGLDFLPIYIGPILVIGLGAPFIARIANLARAQNVTTVADFVSARYGKSQAVAAVAALIALIGSAPYVALQLKAVAPTVLMVVDSFDRGRLTPGAPSASFYLAVSLMLALFAMAFGTRRINPKEHQDGLILAIAVESIVKLIAFLGLGAFVVWRLNNGLVALTEIAGSEPKIASVIQTPPDPAVWVVTTLLSAFAIVLLPRQFHVAVVENHDQRDIRTAAWLFPTYLVLINLFVLPLAIAGLKVFPDASFNRDLTVLALPLSAGARGVALLTMVGGISAATGMVVVESVALAITISNDLVMPLLLRRERAGVRRRGRHRRDGLMGAPDRHRRRSGAGLRLRAHGRRSGPRLDRPLVVRGGGADRAGLSWRPLLASRDRAGRNCRHDRRVANLVLPPAVAVDPARPGAFEPSHARAHGDRVAEPGGARRLRAERARRRGGPVAHCEYRGVCRLFADPPAERARARPGERLRRGRASAASRRRSASGVRRRPRASSRRRSRAILAQGGRAAPS